MLGLLVLGLAACGGAATAGHPANSVPPSPTGSSGSAVGSGGSAASSASPTASVSPTSTTPLLTGAAVKPGEVPPLYLQDAKSDDISGALSFAYYFYKAVD